MVVFTGLWLIGGLLMAKSVSEYAPMPVTRFLFALNCAMVVSFVALTL